jgi:hypothetical protein
MRPFGSDKSRMKLNCRTATEKIQRMIAPLSKFMDWSAFQVSALMMPANDLNSKLEEAIQFLNGPDFIPAESEPAQVEFSDGLHFTAGPNNGRKSR